MTVTAKAINPLRHHGDCSINGASNSLVQNGKCLNRTRFGRQWLQIDARYACPIRELRARPATRIGHSYPSSTIQDNTTSCISNITLQQQVVGPNQTWDGWKGGGQKNNIFVQVVMQTDALIEPVTALYSGGSVPHGSPTVRKSEIKGSSFRRFVSPTKTLTAFCSEGSVVRRLVIPNQGLCRPKAL